MKVSLSQIKKFLAFDLTPQEIADHLTMVGIEVDKIEDTPISFSQVVVAEILEVAPHPDADQLKVATVTDGTQTLQIVCGAPNCRKGMKTALAKVGATLQDEAGKKWTIKKAKLRGVESEGMLCSGQELGLLPSEGILDLPKEAILGEDVAKLFSHPILEISLTPNLGHCMSALGIARELAAILNLKIKKPAIHLEEKGDAIASLISVALEDEKSCPRYSCRIIQDVNVGPSPDWLQKELEECGMRSINNVVDITNWIMHLYGLPLHPFDYDKIEGKKLSIKSFPTVHSFITLDGEKREIPPEVLFICDHNKPLAIAGIMGGEKSEISNATKNVLLEAAYFLPSSIRKSSKRLNLKTDASSRFEKGCDPNSVQEVLDSAAFYIAELCSGKIAKGCQDVYPSPILSLKIPCRLSRINHLLGTTLSLGEVEDLFKRLEIAVTEKKDNSLIVHPPTYRHDLKEEIDLVEEAARLYGYNNIELKVPFIQTSKIPSHPLFEFEREIRARLLAQGLQEFLTCNLISPLEAKLTSEKELPQDHIVSVLQPSSTDQSVLRPSLLPGLLQVAKFNLAHQRKDVAGFEIGKIYFKEKEIFEELPMIGILLFGLSHPLQWREKTEKFDFFYLKGILETLISGLRILNFSFKSSHLQSLHPFAQASLIIDNRLSGAFGEVHPNVLAAFGIDIPLFFAEIDLQELFVAKKREKKMSDIPLYPGSTRDWTVTLKADESVDTIFQLIKKVKSPYLEKFLLLDLYKSEQIGKDRKNATLRFYYRDLNKTISLETVEKEHSNIIKEVERHLS